MKIPKSKKWLALPLSMLIALPVTVQSTLAYIVTQSEPAINTFKPFDSIEGGLIIHKTIDHPYGPTYAIPDHIAFDFEVQLGDYYAGYTVKTSAGDVTADENGSLRVSVKPDVLFGIEGIDEDMQVTVTELSAGAGFSPGGEISQNAVISPKDFVTLEFVNVYSPAPVSPKLSITGEKQLSGRDWQSGDVFSFTLDRMNADSGKWETLGTRDTAFAEDAEEFSRFDFSEFIGEQSYTTIGTYSYRVCEIAGNLPDMIYDDTEYSFDVTVSDDDMDGALEIADICLDDQPLTADENGAYSMELSFTNVFAPETTTTETTTSTAVTTTTPQTTTTEKQSTTTSQTSTAQTTTSTKQTTTTQTTTSGKQTTTTQTTMTTETSTTETTTTTETTPQPPRGKATWSIGMVEAKPGSWVDVPITITGDTGTHIYELIGLIGDAKWTQFTVGDAYPRFNVGYSVDDETGTYTIRGQNADLENAFAEDGSVVLYFRYYIPEDAENGTVYDLSFNGEVTAYDMLGIPLDVTEQNGWIRVVTEEVTLVGYDFELEGNYQFYFSHDPREFKAEDLVSSITRYALYSDGTKGDPEPLTDFSIVDFNGLTPESVFIDTDGAYYVGSIPATVTDDFGVVHEFEGVGTAYIAVKGDVTLTGEADAKDAARILTYSAKIGAGLEAYIYSETDTMMEMFAYFLGDVTGESEDHGLTDSLGNEISDLNAKDSAKILIYAAVYGSGKDADWAVILDEPLPYYTAEIAAAERAMEAAQAGTETS